MDRRVVVVGGVVPLGLLPSPIVPRPFAILFRAAGCRLGYAAASFPSRRRVRSLASPWYGRVCTRVRYVRHVSRTSCPRLRLLLLCCIPWATSRRSAHAGDYADAIKKGSHVKLLLVETTPPGCCHQGSSHCNWCQQRTPARGGSHGRTA